MNNNRYDRHYKLHNFGKQNQDLLLTKKILIIGCGGIGCSTAINLISNGIGTIGLMDTDTVSLSNLHRQYGHTTNRIGLSKVDSLFLCCKEINPECIIIRLNKWFINDIETKELCKEYDLILDCSDNSNTRITVNRVCKEIDKPYIFASAIGWDAQLLLIRPDGPCLECVFPELSNVKDTCTSNGVFGPVPSLIGTLQAIEAIKYLIHDINKINPQLILYSSQCCEIEKINIEKDDSCNVCSTTQNYYSKTEIEDYFGISYYKFLEIKKVSTNWLLIDISVKDEYNVDEMLLDSILFKEEDITKDYLIMNKDKQIYIICNYNSVSSTIVNKYRKEKITNIWFIEEGMDKLIK